MRKNNRLTLIALSITGLLVVLALTILLPQTDSLKHGADAVLHANKFLVCLGLFLMFGTYLAAALVLQIISLKKLRFQRTFLVQLASGFATKLVPAGIGGFALNTRYLTKNKHTVVQASSVMLLNGTLGFAGHIVILAIGILFFRKTFQGTVSFHLPSGVLVIIAGLVFALLLGLGFVFRKKIRKALHDLRSTLRFYHGRPHKLFEGFLAALLVTLCFTTILFVSALCLGFDLSVPEVFLAYTATTIGAAIMPTPGGIGGAEAALTGALVAFGLDTASAFSVALVFRFITFWLPIIPGVICFQILLKRHYI